MYEDIDLQFYFMWITPYILLFNLPVSLCVLGVVFNCFLV